MELENQILHIDSFLTVTLGIVVLFIGKRLNSVFKFLREYSIPEPVTGGLLFSIFFSLIYFLSGISIEFNLVARDFFLVYFFTTIGINANFRDLVSGGKPLAILLVITVVYMMVQNFVGIGVASLFGLDPIVGLLGGTISLIGGHGTAIAWAPRFSSEYGVPNAMEIGIACATFGLILASSIGGPIAKFLISRHRLEPDQVEPMDVGIATDNTKSEIGYLDFLDAILAIHISIIFGLLLNNLLTGAGIHLPNFVTCLFAGILITNTRPKHLPRITGTKWPSRTPAMALIADIALGTFLAMSLMSMQLWTLIDLAGPVLSILGTQVLVVIIMIIIMVFPAMGRNYDAAVISAGFAGFSMGATPTAMANMSAVTTRYGASHVAFIIVPLVGAFFIDLINAFTIQTFLGFFTS